MEKKLSCTFSLYSDIFSTFLYYVCVWMHVYICVCVYWVLCVDSVCMSLTVCVCLCVVPLCLFCMACFAQDTWWQCRHGQQGKLAWPFPSHLAAWQSTKAQHQYRGSSCPPVPDTLSSSKFALMPCCREVITSATSLSDTNTSSCPQGVIRFT